MENREVISLTQLKGSLALYFNRIADGEQFVVSYKHKGHTHKFAFKAFEKIEVQGTEALPVQQKPYDPNLTRRLDDLPLSRTIMNNFQRAGIVYVGDLVRLTLGDLAKIPNMKLSKPIREEIQTKVLDRFGFDWEENVTAQYDVDRPKGDENLHRQFVTKSDIKLGTFGPTSLLSYDQVIIIDGQSFERLAVFELITNL